MKLRGIRIERLQLNLPRSALLSAERSPAALATHAATALARSLRQAGLSLGAASRVHGLDVRVGREEADAIGIADAIHTSIMRSVDPTGNGK